MDPSSVSIARTESQATRSPWSQRLTPALHSGPTSQMQNHLPWVQSESAFNSLAVRESLEDALVCVKSFFFFKSHLQEALLALNSDTHRQRLHLLCRGSRV